MAVRAQQQPTFSIEPLGAKHDRAAFSCGTPALDTYLHKQASQDARKRVATPFVATPDGKTIAGYYTLSQHVVALEDVPEELARRLPKYPNIPATLIGRFAVATTFQGRGMGAILLMDALQRSLLATEQVASMAVVVDAKDDKAASFYTKYGFMKLPRVESRMFLPMGTIAKLFA